MNPDERVDQILEYLYHHRGAVDLKQYCIQTLGLHPEEYVRLTDSLTRDGMIEWNENGQAGITIDGRFTLRNGGYQALFFSSDYQKKLAKEGRTQRHSVGSWAADNTLMWITGASVLVIVAFVAALLLS